MLHVLGHPPPGSSRDTRYITKIETNITETAINAIRIIKRIILLVLSFLTNFRDIIKA